MQIWKIPGKQFSLPPEAPIGTMSGRQSHIEGHNFFPTAFEATRFISFDNPLSEYYNDILESVIERFTIQLENREGDARVVRSPTCRRHRNLHFSFFSPLQAHIDNFLLNTPLCACGIYS
jgi:hypothetical protein